MPRVTIGEANPIPEETTMADRPTPPNPYDFLPQVSELHRHEHRLRGRRAAGPRAGQRDHGRRWRDVSPQLSMVRLPRGHEELRGHRLRPGRAHRPAASGTGPWRTSRRRVTELPSGAGDEDGPRCPTARSSCATTAGSPVRRCRPAGGPRRAPLLRRRACGRRRDASTWRTPRPAVLGFNLFFHTLGRATLVATYEEA